MTINVTNHLNFRGDARAALEFYQSVFGGDIVIITYKDARNVQDPSEADRVMWGQVAAPNGFRVMAAELCELFADKTGNWVGKSARAISF